MLTTLSLGANGDTAREQGLMSLLFDDPLCKQLLKYLPYEIAGGKFVFVGLMRENN